MLKQFYCSLSKSITKLILIAFSLFLKKQNKEEYLRHITKTTIHNSIFPEKFVYDSNGRKRVRRRDTRVINTFSLRCLNIYVDSALLRQICNSSCHRTLLIEMKLSGNWKNTNLNGVLSCFRFGGEEYWEVVC